ncbi:Transcriptional-regulating factor 1, partial [Orchesella cincta]
MVIDPSFHELDILIGDSSNMVGDRIINGSHNHHDLLTPQLLQSNNTSGSSGGGGFPLMDKSNFTFLDCDLNADDLCQAFHLIYVDNNNGADLPLTMDQETLGKVSKMFQDPIPELSLGMSLSDSQGMMKQEVVEPVVCLPNDDPCNLPWEWRNSTSSDNTENSFGNVQDCVNSLLCSSSSDTPDESSTKDPVAGGGYCYTPILSPNSTFCLTPGPDSPFETTSHSLSFISPSPTMGNGSGFSDPSSNLGNPSTSVESLFSSDQPSLQTVSMSMSTTTTTSSSSMGPTEDDSVLQKYSQLNGQQMDAPMYISSFSDLNLSHCDKQGILSISQFAPHQLQLPQQITTVHPNGTPLECLPPINIFSKITPNNSNCNDLYKLGSTYSILDGKEPIFHIPVSNNAMQQQNSFIPSYELFAPLPLPKKVSEKWMSGNADKNKKINVGSEYQAEIPNFRGNKGRHKACRSLDEKLWDPSILDTCSFVEIDNYLEFACCSAVPGGGTNKEYALHLLTLSRGNIREALLRLMEKVPSLPAKLRSYSYLENQRWSSEEIMAFQISLVQTGKDFSRISKAVGSKSQG